MGSGGHRASAVVVAWGGGSLAWGLLSQMLGFSPLPLKPQPHFPPGCLGMGEEVEGQGWAEHSEASLGFGALWPRCPLQGTVPSLAPSNWWRLRHLPACLGLDFGSLVVRYFKVNSPYPGTRETIVPHCLNFFGMFCK